MKQIFTIYKKEIVDTLRDRRSLIRMIIMPLGLFPLLFGVISTVQNSSSNTENARELQVGYFAEGDDLGLRTQISATSGFKVFDVPNKDSLRIWIHDDRLDVGVSVPASFAPQVNALRTDTLLIYGAIAAEIANDRFKKVVDGFQKKLLTTRLDSLHLKPENIKPMETRFVNTASDRETIGKLAGGMLPYIFIIFCYMGCMFPAIDLFTGEKERGTIETLLSAPVDRWKILLGKMLVIITTGISSAALSIIGLFVGLKVVDSGLGELMDVAMAILTPGSVIALLSMLLPLVVFFAGIMIPATVYAKSFKEAATTLQPLNFVILLPAMIGMMPGIELNGVTAAIPILNVVLTTKEIIAGTMDGLLFVEVMASLVAIAVVAVLLSFKGFGNEKNILR